MSQENGIVFFHFFFSGSPKCRASANCTKSELRTQQNDVVSFRKYVNEEGRLRRPLVLLFHCCFVCNGRERSRLYITDSGSSVCWIFVFLKVSFIMLVMRKQLFYSQAIRCVYVSKPYKVFEEMPKWRNMILYIRVCYICDVVVISIALLSRNNHSAMHIKRWCIRVTPWSQLDQLIFINNHRMLLLAIPILHQVTILRYIYIYI